MPMKPKRDSENKKAVLQGFMFEEEMESKE